MDRDRLTTGRRPTSTSGSITDVNGILVGHHQRSGAGWRTGTTVVLAPGGATAAVDVRGGGPGTRETDALRPENLVNRIHAVCLTGGSAYGLAAADGVMAWLAERCLGFPVGVDPGWVVPVVPAAVIFDLGRGGSFVNRPDAGFGYRAASAARARPPVRGAVGAGTGAIAGGLQGGVGTASTLVDGVTVGALAVVNAAGRVIDPATGMPWEATGFGLRRPPAGERQALAALLAPPPPLNTTIGVVATSALLSKAECSKLAAVAHDGLARAIRPAHSSFDGDTVFALATGEQHLIAFDDPLEVATFRDPDSRPAQLARLQEAAARCFAAACTDAIVAAHSHRRGDAPPAYRDVCAGALPAGA